MAVVIYTKAVCPYCVQAKRLLDHLGVVYEQKAVDQNPALLAEMIEKSGGRRTVPQIFIGAVHVGGFDDLSALHQRGELNQLLKKEKES